MSIFDLSDIEASMLKIGVVEIVHPVTGGKTSMRIYVAGPESKEYQAIDRKIRNRSMAFLQKNRNKTITAEMAEDAAIDLLVGATTGWEGVTWGGADLAYSAENVENLYRSFSFIKEQVDSFVGDRSNFFVS